VELRRFRHHERGRNRGADLPTNSPEECEWVAGNSEARFVVCEDATQVAKIQAVRDRLPHLEGLIVMDPEGDTADAMTLDALRERGRGRSAEELRERTAQVTPDQPFTIIYTSGTTGPPKGCVLTHGNYRSVVTQCERADVFAPDDVVYLFLPLAHSFALLIQLVCVDLGVTIAYFGGDTKQVIPELMQVKPTYIPSVPRIFEKLYSLAQQQLSPEEIETIRTVGGRIPRPRGDGAGGARRPSRRVRGRRPEGAVRRRALRGPAAPGGHRRGADRSGDPRVLLGLRRAGARGLRDDRDLDDGDHLDGRPPSLGLPSAGRCPGRSCASRRRRAAGQGAERLPGLLQDGRQVLRRHRRRLAAHGRLGEHRRGRLRLITGRKKDIIITAGGKNLTPANLENDLKQSRWISQASCTATAPVSRGARHARSGGDRPWAQQQGIEDTARRARRGRPRCTRSSKRSSTGVNASYAQVEQIKRFVILDHDFSQETGELTPSLKVKRNVIHEKYAALFDSLYER
jgi:long-chain acyl-CoA synthetase